MSGFSRRWVMLGVVFAVPAVAELAAQDVKTTASVEMPRTTKTAIDAKNPKNSDGRVKAAQPRDDVFTRALNKLAVEVAKNRVGVQPVAELRVQIRQAVPMNLAVGDLDPMAAQWLGQFLPLMRTEVHFLLAVTQATPEQRKAIGAGRNKAARQAAKLYAQSQQRVGRFQNNAKYPQPRVLVQESIVEFAKGILSVEQLERYQVEIKRREEDQKILSIQNIVARMDQDLVLSNEQREKLSVAIDKNWSDVWGQSLETFMYMDQYFPAIPESVLVPILNSKQATVWRGVQKNNGMVVGGFGILNNGIQTDGLFPADEEPDEPKVDALKLVRQLRMIQAKGFVQAVEVQKVEAADRAIIVDVPKDAPQPKKP